MAKPDAKFAASSLGDLAVAIVLRHSEIVANGNNPALIKELVEERTKNAKEMLLYEYRRRHKPFPKEAPISLQGKATMKATLTTEPDPDGPHDPRVLEKIPSDGPHE